MNKLLDYIIKLLNYIFGVSMSALPRNKDGTLDKLSISKASIIYDSNGNPILIRVETTEGIITIPYELKILNELKTILSFIDDVHIEELLDFYSANKEKIDILEKLFGPNKAIKNSL